MSLHKSAYHKALDELLSLEFSGMKLGLDNIRELLQVLGDPHKKFKAIHVAGSNGKGSVSAMLAAVMQANGYKAGLYTSPHLVDFRERIKINGMLISEEYVEQFLKKIWEDVEWLHATFFEVTTALAFAYFADQQIEIAIIEAGLGGRLDSTNILEKPIATVITSISLEHTAILGNTLEQIAGEKAGIMKLGVQAVVNSNLRYLFKNRADELKAPLFFADDYKPSELYAEVQPPFLGRHQVQNLRTVLATLENIDLPLKPEKSIAGIASTQRLTGIRARMENYSYPLAQKKALSVILDVAHNPDAFKFLKEYFIEQSIMPIVVAGFAKDKNISAILGEIADFASIFVTVTAHTHRAMPSNELAELFVHAGIKTIISSTPISGVNEAIGIAKSGETILLCGSHFVVGDFLKEAEK